MKHSILSFVGRVCRRLRRLILSRSRLKGRNGRRAQFDGSPASITILEHETRSAEAGHGIFFLPMLGLTLYTLARGWWDAASWLTLFNLIFNAYPVLLQHYSCIRLSCIIEHLNRCSQTANI
jgi:hypothetical protein